MREKRVECPKCKKAMTAGFVISHRKYEMNRLINWVAGVPKDSVWTGVRVGKQLMLPVTTYRCNACGFLESYAR